MFEFPNGFSFAFNPLCVHKILGIPIGGRLIPSRCSDQFRDAIRNRTGCEGPTPSINELIKFLGSGLDEEDFKRYWTMFSVTVFLCPSTYDCASPDYLSAVEGPSEEIPSYDWSSVVYHKLIVSFETFLDNKLVGALCGCLVVPLVSTFIKFHLFSVVMFNFKLHM